MSHYVARSRTKIEQAMELIDECDELGVPAENYVFDS
jgi:hypothetical protein